MILPRTACRPRALPAILALAALGFASGCERQPAPDTAGQQPSPTVTVSPVVRDAVQQGVEFLGRVAAVEEVDLRARVTGILRERAFEEGALVAQGELLFVIDPEPFEAALEAAQARLESARARAQEAAKTLERTRRLFERKSVAEADLDAAVAAAAQADAQVLVEEAAVRQARIDLGYTRITAPTGGRIGQARYSEGNLIGPDSGVLAKLVSIDPVHVTFSVDEGLLVDVRQRNIEQSRDDTMASLTLGLTLPNGTPYGKRGRLDFVDNVVDPRTGSVTLRGTFPNPDRLLVSGQFVTVRVAGTEPVPQLLVPQAAVQQDQRGKFVLVVDGQGKAAVRRVELGEQVGPDWIVRAGLEEGEQVIVEGVQQVRPGIEVNAVTAGTGSG